MSLLQCVLVMPVYNEAECIEGVLRAWIEEFQSCFQKEFLFIVVNDGSKDQTAAILDRLSNECGSVLQVIHQKNGGHGSALMTGYKAALDSSAAWIFQTDSDDQFLSSDFSKLWTERNRSPFILGHRLERHDAGHRKVISFILKLFLKLIFQVQIRDPNIPYRLIKQDYLKHLMNRLIKIFPLSKGIFSGPFAPNIFLSVMAARECQDLGQVPVHHKERKTGQVSIIRMSLVKACFRSVRELVQFRLGL